MGIRMKSQLTSFPKIQGFIANIVQNMAGVCIIHPSDFFLKHLWYAGGSSFGQQLLVTQSSRILCHCSSLVASLEIIMI